jgi:two-component system phosphate regulon response regulator PhoB
MNDNTPLILVVDDETHILHVVRMKLSNAGFRVMTAEDGEEGLALAREHQPDLIITDFQMPLLTGLQMCERLRQDARTAHTPALMLTARGFSLTQEQMRRCATRACRSSSITSCG